jgi:nitrite reductase (NADH) small subunit
LIEKNVPTSPDQEAGRYFRHMADFVGFGEEEAKTVRATRYIIEKHIPVIVAKFYSHLLEYPPTRKYFLRKDGEIDQEYLQLRMHHLNKFWRRTASAELDDDYAAYVDYVGRTHTSQGADPKIYIPERYVIGQVGFVQHAIGQALRSELEQIDPELAVKASRAWGLLLMVILEMLARAYSDEHEAQDPAGEIIVDHEKVQQLAVETYEHDLGLYRSIEYKDVLVAPVDEIPEGERKIIEVEGLSIGVFHHKGEWHALRNRCLHRAGPICTGSLEDDTLTCPWHGYQYDVTDGKFLKDPSVSLESYKVELRDGQVFVRIPLPTWDAAPVSLKEES